MTETNTNSEVVTPPVAEVKKKPGRYKSEEARLRSLANLRPMGKKTASGVPVRTLRINGIAKRIRQRTNEGFELIDKLLDIVSDKGAEVLFVKDAMGNATKITNGSTPTQKIDAMKLLFERGWGKTPVNIEIGGKDGEPIKIEHTKKEVFEKLVVLLNAGALPSAVPVCTDMPLDSSLFQRGILDAHNTEGKDGIN